VANRLIDHRLTWLAVGLLAGLGFSQFWPHEPALAAVTDRNDKFAMATTPVSILDTVEGVFVLDFLTGRLTGAVLNAKAGVFGHAYFRNVAADFKVDPTGNTNYAIVAGRAQLPSRGRVSMATGVVYVAELSSGRVIAYGFPYNESPRPVPPVEMGILDNFAFREAIQQ
jgi:hypothetical protein